MTERVNFNLHCVIDHLSMRVWIYIVIKGILVLGFYFNNGRGDVVTVGGLPQ